MSDPHLADTLDYLRSEVGKISVAVVKLAEQEQKLVHIMENQQRTDKDIEALQSIVTGPDGLLVRVERNSVRLAAGCTVGSGTIAAVISYAMPLISG
jgi:hypothetical protein